MYYLRLIWYRPVLIFFFVVSSAIPPAVSEVRGDLQLYYKKSRLTPQKDDWPPDQPTSIVNVALIHYKKCSRTQQEMIEISKRFEQGANAVDNLASSHSRVTKDIKKIFTPDPTDNAETICMSFSDSPRRILIEGAPGIGKTILAKEIVYQWANGDLLTECDLVFLVYLRDPRAHKMKSIKDLLNLYTSEKKAAEIKNHLENCRGQNIGFIFDGFDELPASLQKTSYATKIIEGEEMIAHRSIVVVTSRPTATLFLHRVVDRRIEVLGFAKEERDRYIMLSLDDSPTKKQELENYLKCHPIIDSFCFVPLHLAVLLFLFQMKCLPETLTEMNEFFVVHTIYRQLNKLSSSVEHVINKLTDLPKKMYIFVQKLSKLAYYGLQYNQLVFSYDQIKKVCPEIDDMPGALNGFGLLQAVQHYIPRGAGRTTSLNFLHFTMQEYLASLHVSTLSTEQQLILMKTTFWERQFNFMWMMYVGIVGINSPAFVSFLNTYGTALSSDITDSDNTCKDNLRLSVGILSDKRKRLHLFQCYMEAKSNKIPEIISSIFSRGIVQLAGITLLPHHVSSLIIFMTTSSIKHWQALELGNCYLRSIGMNSLLEHVIKNQDCISTLEYVDLSDNDSSPWGVYCAIIRHLHVSNFAVCGEEGMNEYTNEIISSLEANASIQSLTLCGIGKIGLTSIKHVLVNNTAINRIALSWNKLGSEAVKDRKSILMRTKCSSEKFYGNVAASSSNRIIEINILHDGNYESTPSNIDMSNKNIDDNAVAILAFGLYDNITVQSLNISQNEITNDGAIAICECLKNNNTLQNLNISANHITNFGTIEACEFIETNSALQKLNISNNEVLNIVNICECLKNNQTLLELAMTLPESLHSASRVFFIDKRDSVCNVSGQSFGDSGALIASAMLHCANAVRLDASCNKISDIGAVSISECIWKNEKIQEFNLSYNNITCGGIKAIVDAMQINNLHKLDISNNRISDNGAIVVGEYLKKSSTVKELDLSFNTISQVGMNQILDSVSNPTLSLEYVDLSGNAPSPWSVYCNIIKNCCGSTLTLCGDDKMEEYIREIADGLQRNLRLTSLTLCNIGRIGLQTIRDAIANNTTLNKLQLAWKKITSVEVKCRRNILLHTKYPYNVSNSNSSTSRVLGICILYDEYNGATPKDICFPNDEISDAALHLIMFGLYNNKVVQKLEISCSNIPNIRIVKECLENNHTLTELMITFSKVSTCTWDKIMLYVNRADKICNLSGRFIGDDGATIVSAMLHGNTQIITLDVSSNRISDEGVKAICNSLKNNAVLQELNLSHNEITDKGIQLIVNAVQACTALQRLDISDNTMTDLGAVAISNCLNENSLLQELNLSCNKISSDGIVHVLGAVSNTKTLRKLDISHNKITDVGATAIGDCLKYSHSLQDLNVSWNMITSNGAEKIAEGITVCRNLRRLCISHNSISEGGIIAISDSLKLNATLLELVLPWHESSLIINAGDSVCDMHSENMGNTGAFVVAALLQSNIIVEKLDISYNCICDVGAMAISDFLKNNTVLKELNMSGNCIAVKGAVKLGEALEINSTLKKFYLSKCVGESIEAILSKLARNAGLQEIDFSHNKITINSAKRLAEVFQLNTTLRKLDISSCNISTQGALIISKSYVGNGTLKEFIMSWENNILVNTADPCCNLPSKKLGNSGALIVSSLLDHASIHKLNLYDNKISIDGAVAVSSCLKSNCTTIEELNMSKNSISNEGIAKLCEAIQMIFSLQKLELSKCMLNEGLEIIFNILKSSAFSMLLEVDVSHNTISIEGAYEVAEVLKINCTLQKFDISYCGIPKDGVVVISEAYRDNTTLGELVISWGMDQITVNTKVEYCQLSNKSIDDTGALIISNFLYNNVYIKKLDVSCNRISDQGALAISNCLKNNNVLQKLDLSNNAGITPTGTETVFGAIQENTSLEKLHIVF